MSDDLSELVAGVRDSLEREIVRERRLVSPDFAAVVEAARERNPDLVSEAAVVEVGEFAPIVELGAELDRRGGSVLDGLADAQLDEWLADARTLAEVDIAARRLAGVPPLRGLVEPEPARKRWAIALAVAAVLIGAAVAVPRLLESFVDGNYQEAESTSNQAEYVGPDRETNDGARVRLQPEPPPIKPVAQRAIQRSAASDEGDAPRPPKSRARTGERDRIATLDAEAQALWAQGDLAGAEGCFREIIEIAGAGQRRYADLAYGDLFTLARQRKDEAAELALWREYVERFPRGRFADDARAGLCRRGPEAEREACWRAYLDDFPDGVHTRAASRVLGIDASGLESP